MATPPSSDSRPWLERYNEAERVYAREPARALELLLSCRADLRAEGDPNALQEALFLEGSILLQLGRAGDALGPLQEARRRARPRKRALFLARVYYEIGACHSYLHDLKEAQRSFDAMLQHLRDAETRDPLLEIQLLSGVGNRALRNREFATALEYYDLAAPLIGEEHEERRAVLLTNRGSALVGLERFEEGIESIEKGLALHRSYDSRISVCYDLHSLALSLLLAGRMEESLARAREGTAHADREGVTILSAICRSVAGEALNHLQRPVEAQEVLEEALPIAERVGNDRYRMNILGHLSRALEEQQKWKEAIRMLRAYTELRDTVRDEEHEPRMKQLELRFQNALRKRDAERLQETLRKREDELQRLAQELTAHRQGMQRFREECLERFHRRENDTAYEKWLGSATLTGPAVVQQFESHFSRIHGDFIEKLTERYPGLTRRQMRLCSLLRSGLKTSEIAELLGQNEESVRKARTRLRKQLGLERGNRLTGFLQTI